MNDIFDEEFINKVYMYCYKHFYDSEKVQDLAQDILLEAVAAQKSGREIQNFYAWFWRMAHNKICTYIKLKSNEFVSLESIIGGPHESAGDSEIDKKLLHEEEIVELNQAVAKISKIHKEVIILFYLKQHTTKEIAKILSVPEGTVKRRLHDAKKEIKINLTGTDNVRPSVKNIKCDRKVKVTSMNQNKFNDFKPASLNIWVGGNGFWGDEISRQIYIACMKQAKSVEEIAEEVCVAPAYIESIIQSLIENKSMKPAQDGKYLTDFIIYPEQAYTDYRYELAELFSNIKKPLTERLYELKDEICAVDFYGNHFDFEYLLWILYWFAANSLNKSMSDKNKARWEGKVPENNGKSYRMAGSVTFSGETIENHGERKAITWSNIHTAYGTANHGRVRLANLYDYHPFPRDRHTRINNFNINLIMKIYENADYTADEYEQEYAANLISQNIIKNEHGKLYLNLPVMSQSHQNQINDILSEKFEDIAAEYVEKASEICDRILLPLTRADLLEEYAHWIMGGGAFWVLPYLFYENEYLQKPEDYNSSAAGLCLYIN